MNEPKVKIREAGDHPYAHLLPIVELLVRDGNSPVTQEAFYEDRDGWRCDLRLPIDFALIQSAFEFPRSIALSQERDAILCQHTWTVIAGSLNPERKQAEGGMS